MNNYLQPGEVVQYTAGADIASGAVVPLTSRCGIALGDIANGATGSVALAGVYTVGKTTGQTWSIGQALYYVSGTAKLSTSASGNTPAGYAFAAAASDATTGELLLGGSALLAVQAANQAALAGTLTGTTDGTLADVAAIALSTSNTYTDAAVNTAVNTAITSINLQIKELQAVVNSILTKLKAAGLMVAD